MAPHPDRLVALENDPVAVILGNLQDGVVRIDVTGIFCLEGSNLFQVVFLEDILALNNCKRRRRQASIVVEVGILRHGIVGILHPDGRGHFT